MVDWKIYIGEGPWTFAPQANKWGYLNNKRWTEFSASILFSQNVGNDINLEGQHLPCGHWHRVLNVAPPDDIFIVNGHPVASSPAGIGDKCVKRATSLAYLTHYGTRGCTPDQLQCPYGVTVDQTYVYIANVLCGEIAKRLKSDLSYVDEISVGAVHSVHTNGLVLFAGFSNKVEERNLANLSLIRTLTDGGDPEGDVGYAEDITSDDQYLYVADRTYSMIKIYDINSLAYVGSFGRNSEMFFGALGVWSDGAYIYVYDLGGSSNRLYRIQQSSWAVLNQSEINYNQCLFGYGGLLYAVSDALDDMIVRNQIDLSIITNVSGEFSAPTGVWVDGNYIYVCNDYYVVALDYVTYALAFENGDRTGVVHSGNNGYDYCQGITGDATHVYVIDSGNNRIVKRLKSDLSYVSEYSDPGFAVMWWPHSVAVDGTYVYVCDRSRHLIHRINKSTMAYVDNFASANLYVPYNISIAGNYLYVADGGSTYSFVRIFNLTTLAVVDTSPSTYGSSDDWLDQPLGIDLDFDKIYVSAIVQGVGYIKVFSRFTHSFIASFVVDTDIKQIAVDSEFIYAAFFDIAGYTRKYNKNTFNLEAQVSEEYATSVDTWYDINSGTYVSNEPQVWPMT